jgi:hypothetical protein
MQYLPLNIKQQTINLFFLTLPSFTYNPNTSPIERVKHNTIYIYTISTMEQIIQCTYHILNKMSSVVSSDCL